MSDLISRTSVINLVHRYFCKKIDEAEEKTESEDMLMDLIEPILADNKAICTEIRKLPPVEAPTWIPCSERLPEKRDWYLALFKEPDTGFIGLPYIADYLMGKHTEYTTKDGWIIKDCTDRNDCESLYHKNLECFAWMPLPEPYKEK